MSEVLFWLKTSSNLRLRRSHCDNKVSVLDIPCACLQVKGAEKIFYGLDDIADSKTIIIVEGEIDKLAMEEAGYLNVVSVPGMLPQSTQPLFSMAVAQIPIFVQDCQVFCYM
jgi:hypothetical protein